MFDTLVSIALGYLSFADSPGDGLRAAGLRVETPTLLQRVLHWIFGWLDRLLS